MLQTPNNSLSSLPVGSKTNVEWIHSANHEQKVEVMSMIQRQGALHIVKTTNLSANHGQKGGTLKKV